MLVHIIEIVQIVVSAITVKNMVKKLDFFKCPVRRPVK